MRLSSNEVESQNHCTQLTVKLPPNFKFWLRACLLFQVIQVDAYKWNPTRPHIHQAIKSA